MKNLLLFGAFFCLLLSTKLTAQKLKFSPLFKQERFGSHLIGIKGNDAYFFYGSFQWSKMSLSQYNVSSNRFIKNEFRKNIKIKDPIIDYEPDLKMDKVTCFMKDENIIDCTIEINEKEKKIIVKIETWDLNLQLIDTKEIFTFDIPKKTKYFDYALNRIISNDKKRFVARVGTKIMIVDLTTMEIVSNIKVPSAKDKYQMLFTEDYSLLLFNKDNIEATVLYIKSGTEELQKIPMDIPAGSYNDLKMLATDDGNVVYFICNYGKKGSTFLTKGFCITKIDLTGAKAENSIMYDLDLIKLKDYAKAKGMENFEIFKIIPTDNGEITVVAYDHSIFVGGSSTSPSEKDLKTVLILMKLDNKNILNTTLIKMNSINDDVFICKRKSEYTLLFYEPLSSFRNSIKTLNKLILDKDFSEIDRESIVSNKVYGLHYSLSNAFKYNENTYLFISSFTIDKEYGIMQLTY